MNSCDAALKAQVELNIAKDTQIQNYETESSLQKQIIEDQRRDADRWYHDPIKIAAGTTVVVVILELVTGVLHK